MFYCLLCLYYLSLIFLFNIIYHRCGTKEPENTIDPRWHTDKLQFRFFVAADF